MKNKILFIIIGVLLLVSVVVNIIQKVDYSKSIRLLSWQLDEKESEIESLKGRIDKKQEEADEYYNLWSDVSAEKEKLAEQIKRQKEYENSGIDYIALQELSIHSKFKESSAILGYVPKGGIVKVKNSFFDHMWEVTYNGVTGWVLVNIGKGEFVMDDDYNVSISEGVQTLRKY